MPYPTEIGLPERTDLEIASIVKIFPNFSSAVKG
jgi:hypothetical protein